MSAVPVDDLPPSLRSRLRDKPPLGPAVYFLSGETTINSADLGMIFDALNIRVDGPKGDK